MSSPVIDSVTLTVASDTPLEPGEPLNLGDDGDLLRLRIGDQVLLWIARGEAMRLIAAIVAASGMQALEREVDPVPPSHPGPTSRTDTIPSQNSHTVASHPDVEVVY
jgi:hypothetical protein